MKRGIQLPLFVLKTETNPSLTVEGGKNNRSGTFVDNMRLPIHRWFRYSAGFSAEWAEQILEDFQYAERILDPFAGSGTALLAADRVGISSIGIEAHPFVARVARAKLLWPSSIYPFREMAQAILQEARGLSSNASQYPDLINKCFFPDTLDKLDRLKRAWLANQDESPASELIWLAITTILRPTSSAGTAQWQYILPNKTKKVVSTPYEAFQIQTALMQADMREFQSVVGHTSANIVEGDARNCPQIKTQSIDIVITSPPYANNYDYADATRFEMSFWGDVQSWGDLHNVVRKNLVVSSSQHASIEKLELDELLQLALLEPIKAEITEVCHKLSYERLSHGGKKHYHTMIAAYFVDLAKTWLELRRVCKPGAKVYFVIGDSAPYGIYVPVESWLGELALGAGFRQYSFEKLRDRNVKWKNRKHRVPLQEGILTVSG
jgi:DNA modification methylase